MMAKLDDLLNSASNPTEGKEGLAQLRAAVFAELEVPPARSWRGDVVMVISVCWLAFVLSAVVLLAVGQLAPSLLMSRALSLSGLLFVGAFCAFAALAPRRPGQLLAGFAVAAVGLVGLVLVRGEGHVSALAPWVCTVSHLGLSAGPMILALAVLKKSAIDPARAALLGLGVGATGAMLGELACEQSWAHVAVWHLGAWAGLAAIASVVSRRLVPGSYAP